MTHFLISFMLVSFFALPQAFGTSEETPVELKTHTLKVTYGTSFRQPTKKDLAALPAEKIDARATSSRGPDGRVKVVYEPTEEPLTLQRMCEGLRAGHVFTIAFSIPAGVVYNFFSYTPERTTAEGEQRASYFKAVLPGFSMEDWQWSYASKIFQDAFEYIEWPHHTCLHMKPIEGTPETYMMPTLRSPAPSCTQMLVYLQAQESLMASQCSQQDQ